MSFLSGRRRDPILADIKDAVREGYFDRREPNELSTSSVEELLAKVEMMSPERRRTFLAEIGHLRRDRRLGFFRGKRRKKAWLSR
tara:strand:- start:200 stop:454 length:255 start_codon:yes stop_codon:yes gene_type:complete